MGPRRGSGPVGEALELGEASEPEPAAAAGGSTSPLGSPRAVRPTSPLRPVNRTGSGAGPSSALSIAARKAAAAQYGSPRSVGNGGGSERAAADDASVSRATTGSAERRMTLSLTNRPERALAMLSGLGLYYSDSPVGIPPVMRHFLQNVDAMHQVGIILTVRFLPMPIVTPVERLLVRSVDGMPNFYQVVARYGYQDIIDHRAAFVSQVITHILHKLELKAGLMIEGHEDDFIHELEGDYVEGDDTQAGAEVNSRGTGLHAIQETQWQEDAEEERQATGRPSHGQHLREVRASQGGGDPPPPLVQPFAMQIYDRLKIMGRGPEASQVAKDCLEAAQVLIETAQEHVVYYLGRAFSRPNERDHNLLHNITIGGVYRTLEMLAYTDSEAWQIPLKQMVELGMALEI